MCPSEKLIEALLMVKFIIFAANGVPTFSRNSAVAGSRESWFYGKERL
jgi:hypothetical protein